MKLLKNKLIIILPILIIAILVIFGAVMIPTINPLPVNLPIALVNEDTGMETPDQGRINLGEEISLNIQEISKSKSDQDPIIEWIPIASYEQVQDGLDNQKYYAALVIPKDFSQKQVSLQTTTPVSPNITILINQGAFPSAVAMSTQTLNGIVDNLNNTIRLQLLEGFEKQGVTLTPEQAATLAAPITKTLTYMNEVGENSANGNAPVMMFQPFWMSTIVGSALFTMVMSKLTFNRRSSRLKSLLIQATSGVLLGIIVGFGLTWYLEAIGIHVPLFTDTALYIAIAYLSFFLMQSAVLSWVGLKGDILFIIILFFGSPLLSLPPEFMSPFYRDWIYSWLPIRFMVEGLRSLFYFDSGLSWNEPMKVLVGVGVVSFLVLIGSAIKVRVKSNQEQQQLDHQGAVRVERIS